MCIRDRYQPMPVEKQVIIIYAATRKYLLDIPVEQVLPFEKALVTMVYGGLVNKNIVAGLQARGVNALGLTGADMDVIRSGFLLSTFLYSFMITFSFSSCSMTAFLVR